MSGTAAARLNDPIAHTNAHARFWAKFVGGVVGGIVAGALAGAAVTAIIGTGGAAAAPIMAAVAVGGARFLGGLGGAALGEVIADKLIPEKLTVTGKITTASHDVFINSKARGAARASPETPIDQAICSKHSPPIYLAEGSETVFVNSWVMSRKDDHTTCGAKISEGSPNVFVGGPTARVRNVADEVPFISKAIVTIFSLLMLARGLRCLPKLARQGRSALPCLVEGALSAGVGLWGLVSSVGHPVIAATGGKVLSGAEELDFELPGPIPLAWQRLYSSHDVRDESLLGRGWSMPYSMELVLTANQGGEPVAILYDDQGRDIEFSQLEPGTGIYSQSEGYWLWRSEGGHYFAQSIEGAFWLFASPEENLPEQRLKLQRIEDRNANFIELRWNRQGQLHQITDSTGRLLELRYGNTNRLRQIALIAGAPGETPGILVNYGYGATGQLTDVTNRTGQVVRRFGYNPDGLMTLHANAAGLECHYAWQGTGKWARVVRHWTNEGEHYEISYRIVEGIAPTSSQAHPIPAATPDTVIGQTRATDQLGRVQTWDWNTDYRILAYTNPAGQCWRAAYNQDKQRLSLTAPDGNSTRYCYDSQGLLASETDALGRTRSTGWTPQGLPWRETAPDGKVTRYTWDERGNLSCRTDPDGSQTHYIYDTRGLPLRITDARGGVKRFTWDARALLRSHTDCSGQTTRYSYDGYGHLTRITDALGQITTFTHDPLGRLRGQSLPDGAHHAYDYDGAGRLTGATDPLSRISRFAWDGANRLTARQDAEGRQIELHYDKAGRLSDLINENGAAYRFTYDAADRLSEEHRPDGTRLSIQYDANGAPILLTRYPGIGDEIDEEAPILPDPSDPASRTAETGVHRELQNTAPETRVNKGLQGSAPETPVNSGLAGSLLSPDESGLPQHTHLIRDAAGRLIEKRTAHHLYRYAYDAADRLTEARKFALALPEALDTAGLSSAYPTPPAPPCQSTAESRVNKGLQGSAPETPVNSRLAGALPGDKPPESKLTPLHSVRFAYDALGRLIEERATDETCGQTHTLCHEHDALGNRTRTLLPTLPEEDALRALNYLYYGSGHLHQINFSYQRAGEETPRHQLIADIERDALHRETARSQGALRTRYALDPLGRRLGLWSQSADFSPEQPLAANDEGWLQALARAGQSTNSRRGQHPSPASHPLDGLLKAYIYDKAGELRRVRHSSQGDTLYAYDATGRITNKATSVNTISNETFAYDPAGNLLDPSSQMALSRRTQHPQAGYVRDNLVRVFEDKRFSYDGFGRLIEKKIGRHTRQRFTWDEEDHLIAVTTTRRPGTDAQSEQTVRFTYDALGRRISKTDAFGTTFFIWEGMRLIEERRGQHVITYVYEPGSYVPLARLDATGLPRQGASPEPPVNKGLQGSASETPANSGLAGSLSETRIDKGLQGSLPGRIGSGLAGDAQSTRAAGQPKLCEVYYFHTDQVGLPEELTNAQGQRIWQASYKTWGNTVREAWAYANIDGSPIFTQDQGQMPDPQAREQNLRFQGQYLDRDTGLHYNTFRYYDPDIGRFISPDPIGLAGDLNLFSYVTNPIAWIDPLGWMPWSWNPNGMGHHLIPRGKANSIGLTELGTIYDTPTFFPKPYQPGMHEELHRAIKPDIGKIQGPWTGSADDLYAATSKGLDTVSHIKGDLKIPATGEVIASNVTPKETHKKLLDWFKNKKGPC